MISMCRIMCALESNADDDDEGTLPFIVSWDEEVGQRVVNTPIVANRSLQGRPAAFLPRPLWRSDVTLFAHIILLTFHVLCS
jgi:hypothetical protein